MGCDLFLQPFDKYLLILIAYKILCPSVAMDDLKV